MKKALLFVAASLLALTNFVSILRAAELTEARDLATGIHVGLPRDLPGRWTTTSRGSNWRSHDRTLTVDTLRFQADRTLENIRERLRSIAGRQITRDQISPQGLILEGSDRDQTRFLVEVLQRGDEKRGLSIVYPSSGGRQLEALARQVMSSMKAFPGMPQVAASQPTTPSPPPQLPIGTALTTPSQFNPPNADVICREEFDAFRASAQLVKWSFPDQQNVTAGETVWVSWTAPQFPKFRGDRGVYLRIDVPIDTEIPPQDFKSSDNSEFQVYPWSSSVQADTLMKEYFPTAPNTKRITIRLNATNGPAPSRLALRFFFTGFDAPFCERVGWRSTRPLGKSSALQCRALALDRPSDPQCRAASSAL